MDKDRIKKLADFFYSSDDASDVPLRVSVIRGMYSGHDLNKESFIDFMKILENSTNLKDDLNNFWNNFR